MGLLKIITMGLIIAAGNTKPAFPYDYYYGVKININVADTALERVERLFSTSIVVELHNY